MILINKIIKFLLLKRIRLFFLFWWQNCSLYLCFLEKLSCNWNIFGSGFRVYARRKSLHWLCSIFSAANLIISTRIFLCFSFEIFWKQKCMIMICIWNRSIKRLIDKKNVAAYHVKYINGFCESIIEMLRSAK